MGIVADRQFGAARLSGDGANQTGCAIVEAVIEVAAWQIRERSVMETARGGGIDTVAGRVVEGAAAQLAEAPEARLEVTSIDPEIGEGVVRVRLDSGRIEAGG